MQHRLDLIYQNIKLKCRDIESTLDRQIPIPYEEINLGNRVTHRSHKLFKLRVMYVCMHMCAYVNVCICVRMPTYRMCMPT